MPSAETFTGTRPAETHYAEMACRPLDASSASSRRRRARETPAPIWEKDRLVRNVQLLTRLAGILKIPALVTVQYAKGLGNTVPEIAPCCPHFADRQADVLLLWQRRVLFLSETLARPAHHLLLCGMETTSA